MVDIEKINKIGWARIEGVESIEDLISIANYMGNIIPHPNGEKIFCLKPSDGKSAVKGTFSNVFGYSEFPLHTDTAFWSVPARYLILGMIEQSACDTHIVSVSDVFLRLGDEVLKLARTSIYMIDTIEEKKYLSLFFKHQAKLGFRFDANCMKPINKDAKMFHSKIRECFSELESTPIVWSGKTAVILDNWNTLHGRRAVSHKEKNRKLFRIYTG